MSRYTTGQRVRVFDPDLWQVTGDIEDNDQFWMPATIYRFYSCGGMEVADVKFDHRVIMSRAHFTDGFKAI